MIPTGSLCVAGLACPPPLPTEITVYPSLVILNVSLLIQKIDIVGKPLRVEENSPLDNRFLKLEGNTICVFYFISKPLTTPPVHGQYLGTNKPVAKVEGYNRPQRHYILTHFSLFNVC